MDRLDFLLYGLLRWSLAGA